MSDGLLPTKTEADRFKFNSPCCAKDHAGRWLTAVAIHGQTCHGTDRVVRAVTNRLDRCTGLRYRLRHGKGQLLVLRFGVFATGEARLFGHDY